LVIHHVDVRLVGASMFLDDIKVKGACYTHQQFEKRGKKFFMRMKRRTVVTV